MQILAAEGDTWGIPGPTFLAAFVWLALLVVVGSMIYRAFLFAGRGGRETLHPQQAGFVNGGPPLAVYTSLAALRSAGAVGATSGGALAQAGPPPMHATPLDHAVYAAAGRSVSTRSLVDDPGVAAALAQLRHGLEEKGLLLSPLARRAARTGPVIGLFLAALGVVRVVAGIANDKPVAGLVLVLVILVPVVLVQVFRKPASTRAGRRAVLRLRREYAHLSPAKSPAYATYGMAGAALGVALFGTASLWALDPGFAAEAEIQRNLAAGGYAGYSGSTGGATSSCSSGSSCSSASSCSSGSSCGGGGGCGGGGCGG